MRWKCESWPSLRMSVAGSGGRKRLYKTVELGLFCSDVNHFYLKAILITKSLY